jgi:hypothetical protein
LLIYKENTDKSEDINLETKINSIVAAKAELISILKNPKSIDESVVKAQSVKDFYACIDYLLQEKGYTSNEQMVLTEYTFTDFREFIQHTLDWNINPGRL